MVGTSGTVSPSSLPRRGRRRSRRTLSALSRIALFLLQEVEGKVGVMVSLGDLLISCRILSVIATVVDNSCSSGSCPWDVRPLRDGDGVGWGPPGDVSCEV